MKELNKLIRPNILSLSPYSSARNEYKGKEAIFLDANENPYNYPFNRYPDPLQTELKKKIAKIKKLNPEQIFLGNGSDEAIDLIIRIFCEPQKDNIISINPSYGMYKVCADINNVAIKMVSLNSDFSLDSRAILEAADNNTKLVFLCSPNNPTANSFSIDKMLALAANLHGILVVDEAYIDFSSKPSLLKYLQNTPNLIVLQTFSKAWGMAGIRLGMAFADAEIISYLNKVKYPYNINLITQNIALEALHKTQRKEKWVKRILSQRNYLMSTLADMPLINKVYPSDTNFFMIQLDNPQNVYNYLREKKIILRDRSNVHLCNGCLRITVGTKAENKLLIKALRKYSKALSK